MRSLVAPTVAWICLSGLGCAAGPPAVLPELPSPDSVTKDEPGGDAPDPHGGALLRLLQLPLHYDRDKPRTLLVSLPDGEHWQRVRIWGFPSRVAFRYGEVHHAITAVFYSEAEPGDTPDTCLQHFVTRARRVAKAFQVDAGPLRREEGLHQPRLSVLEPPAASAARTGEPDQRRVDRPMPIVRTEADVATLEGGHWIAAAASFHTWPGRCLVQGFAVDGTHHPELARKVVDRWVAEAAGQLIWTSSLWEAPAIENR